jgi:DNA-binding GntR family transcriptional regulator
MSLTGIVPLEQSKGLKTRVYEALRELIGHMDIYHSKDLIRLDERLLAEQLGVSRTPVREAISRLEQEGLVQNIARRGSFVIRKTKLEILDIVDVWAALESMSARLATSRASDEEIAELRSNFATFDGDDARAHIDEYSDTNIVRADHADGGPAFFPHARDSHQHDQGSRPGHAVGNGP